MPEIHVVLIVLTAVMCALLTPVIRRVATHVGAIDRPGERRVHETPVPRLGGVAIAGAGLGALAVAEWLGCGVISALRDGGWPLGWLLAGSLLALLTGVLDDVVGLRPLSKLGLITVSAGVVLCGGSTFEGFTDPFSGIYVSFGPLGGVATLIWIITVTNAFNLIDGLDGLAAGVAVIASATLLAVSLLEGRAEAALLWSVLVGALLGFLPYNFFPASIFLGDSGSLLLGFLLAVLAVQSLVKGATLVVVLVPVLALGLPVIEVILTVMRRTRARGARSVFQADRGHIHHQLLSRGLTHKSAVLTLYVVCLALSAVAMVAVLARRSTTAVVVALASIAMYLAIRWLRPRTSEALRNLSRRGTL